MTDLTPAAPAAQSPFDAIRQVRADGTEYWSARELQAILGYDEWRKFDGAIDRAETSMVNQGINPRDHVVGAAKKVSIGSGATRSVDDYELSRYACYLVAMNGDPRKPEVAAAQAYFAVRTREAETAAPGLPHDYETALVALLAEHRERKAIEARAAELEVPARAWNHMVDANGTLAVGDAAKALCDRGLTIGRQRLFEAMAAWGWIYRAGARDREAWRAYQHQLECGRLVEKLNPSFLNRRTGEYEIAAPTIRVTTKGLDEMFRRLTIKAVPA